MHAAADGGRYRRPAPRGPATRVHQEADQQALLEQAQEEAQSGGAAAAGAAGGAEGTTPTRRSEQTSLQVEPPSPQAFEQRADLSPAGAVHEAL